MRIGTAAPRLWLPRSGRLLAWLRMKVCTTGLHQGWLPLIMLTNVMRAWQHPGALPMYTNMNGWAAAAAALVAV